MDFLNEHGAIIYLNSKSITLSEDQSIPIGGSRSHYAVRLLEGQVSIPPNFSIITSVSTETPADIEDVIEGDRHPLFGREICVARTIARLHGRKLNVMLTSFSQDFKHINEVTTIAYIEEIVETSNAFVVGFWRIYLVDHSSQTRLRLKCKPPNQ